MNTTEFQFPPRVIGFDLETTGVDAHNDRIVTAALVICEAGQQPVTHTWLVNPGVPIPTEASAIHGVTTERAVAEGVDPVSALTGITSILADELPSGVPVVAFNAAFDLTMLESENRRHGLPALSDCLSSGVTPVVDPMVLDRHADRYRRKVCGCGCGAVDRTLDGCCLHYGVSLTAAHTADADALAAVRLWPAIVYRFPRAFAGLSLDGLHRAQVGWRAEQMDSLRAFFDRGSIAHDWCDPSWPILGVA